MQHKPTNCGPVIPIAAALSTFEKERLCNVYYKTKHNLSYHISYLPSSVKPHVRNSHGKNAPYFFFFLFFLKVKIWDYSVSSDDAHHCNLLISATQLCPEWWCGAVLVTLVTAHCSPVFSNYKHTTN